RFFQAVLGGSYCEFQGLFSLPYRGRANTFHAHPARVGGSRMLDNRCFRTGSLWHFGRLPAVQRCAAQPVRKVIKGVESGADGGAGTGDAEDHVLARLYSIRKNAIHEGDKVGCSGGVVTVGGVVYYVLLFAELPLLITLFF